MRLPVLHRRADHAERGAVAGGGQRAGVAVGEHARAVGQQRRTVLAHGAVGPDVLREDLMGLRQQRVGLGGRRVGGERLPLQPHALEGPEQVDGRGPARRQHLETAVHGPREFGARGVPVPQRLQCHAIGGGAADRRRAANHHVADAGRHRLGAVAGQVVQLRRQHPLVDHLQPPVAPAQGLDRGC